MESTPHKHHKIFVIIALVFAISLGQAAAGWFIANGIYNWRSADRSVSVKGIAERKVKADLAIWDIGYKVTGDDLIQLTTESLKIQETITSFVTKNGFTTNEVEQQRLEVLDQHAREYQSDRPKHRYIITGGVTLRTPKVDLVNQISPRTTELIQQGIVLSNRNDSLTNPRYLFTKLDEIRPQMLEQATKSARLVAKQFATNSDSKLGQIRHASQGVFQIMSIDSNAGQNYGDDNEVASINKTIRVVVSIEYMLKN